jgi:polycystin 1L2
VNVESCKGKSTIARLNLTCESDYDLFNEEQRSFLPGWIEEQATKNYSESIRNAFVYNSSKQLDTYLYVGNHATYGSGGYVYQFRGRVSDLRSNLSQLHQLGWIDDKTRAVIIQCTLYNPNVQMFTSVTLLAEFLSTGGVIPTTRFEPIHFQGSMFIYIFTIELNIFI